MVHAQERCMETYENLRPTLKAWARMEHATTDATVEPTAETTVEQRIAKYLALASEIKRLGTEQDELKTAIVAAMERLGVASLATAAGRVTVTEPTPTVSWDAKALDILYRDDPALAERLINFRKETYRAGTVRITANK